MEISTRCEKKFAPEPPLLFPLSVSPEYSGSAHFFFFQLLSSSISHSHSLDKHIQVQ